MQLQDIFGYSKKWLWLLLLACLLGGTAGYVENILQPELYQSDTTLFITLPNRGDNSSILGEQQVAKAFAFFPQSTPVLEAVVQQLGDKRVSYAQLAPMVSVDNTANTQLVTIHVRDHDPKRVAWLAMAIAEQSIAQFQKEANDISQMQFTRAEIDRVTTEIKNLEDELATVQAQPDPNITAQADHISRLTAALGELQLAYAQMLNYYQSGTQITVMQPAAVPTSPVGAGPVFAIAIGALVGLIVIVAVIIFIEQNDTLLRSPRKVRLVTEVPLLATVGNRQEISRETSWLNGHQKLSADIIVATTGSQQNEQDGAMPTAKLPAIQTKPLNRALAVKDITPSTGKQGGVKHVQTELLTLGVLLRRNNPGSLLITSPERGDGKTVIAAQLALGLARIGVDVILLDANLHQPRLHTIFGLTNTSGLSTWLTASKTVTNNWQRSPLAGVQQTVEPHLSILPAGPPVASPAELLSSPEMQGVLQQLCQQALVIIDSSAVADETVILADKCESVLLVVDASTTTTAMLRHSLETLALVSANVWGIVLNKVKKEKGYV